MQDTSILCNFCQINQSHKFCWCFFLQHVCGAQKGAQWLHPHLKKDTFWLVLIDLQVLSCLHSLHLWWRSMNKTMMKDNWRNSMKRLWSQSERCRAIAVTAQMLTPLEKGIRIGDPLKEDIISHFGNPTGSFEDFPQGFLFSEHLCLLGTCKDKTASWQKVLAYLIREIILSAHLLLISPFRIRSEFAQGLCFCICGQIHLCTNWICERFCDCPSCSLSMAALITQEVCIMQILKGICEGIWEENFQEWQACGKFQLLHNEDNPFLLFCRQCFNMIIIGDFDSWVRSVHNRCLERLAKIDDSWKVKVHLEMARALSWDKLFDWQHHSVSTRTQGHRTPWLSSQLRHWTVLREFASAWSWPPNS